MAITSRKITTYAKNIVDLSDQPNKDGLTAAQLKAFFDWRTDEEVKTSINGIVDDLVATTDGASGADQIGATPLPGGTGNTVQEVLEEIDGSTVHNAGDETVAGVKTFSSSPIVPTPTTDMQASTKKYVDDLLTLGQESLYSVINQSGSTITDGTVVRSDGTLGASGKIKVVPAIADGSHLAERVMGIATQDIPNGDVGFVAAWGKIRNIDTTGGAEAWSDGEILWLSPTVAGGLTKTKPEAPNLKILMGIVIKAHSNGTLFARVLHGSKFGYTDSNAEFASEATGETVVYNEATERWENKNLDAEYVGYDNATSGLTATETQSAIDELASEKVDTADIVNDLTTGGETVPLSAEQGKELKTDIGDQTYTEQNYVTDSESATASIDELDIAVKDVSDVADAAIPTASIVNDLTTGGTAVPLSAEQGKTLQGEVGTLASLSTTEKGSLVGAINEVDDHADTNATKIGTLASLTTTEKTNLVGAINELDTDVGTNATAIGTLASLTTTEKTNLVGAINEVDAGVGTNATAIGTLASLTTTEKTNLVGAINELDTDKVETSAITNGLTETGTGKVLDARQGKALSDKIGNQIFTEQNVVINGESTTVNLNLLDISMLTADDEIPADPIPRDADLLGGQLPSYYLSAGSESYDNSESGLTAETTQAALDEVADLISTISQETDTTTARFVIGTSAAGWTVNECNYLCDGTADDVAINAAITALPATGGEIVILDGTYNITAKIDVTKDNVSIRGNGNATILKRMFNSSVQEGVITLTSRSGCKIADLQVDGNKGSYNTTYNYGIYLSGSSNNTITGNTCNNNNYGIYLSGSSSNNTITDNTCNNNNISGIYLANSSNNNTVTGNNCNNNSNTGIHLANSSSNNIITCNTCNNNNNYGIYLSGSSNINTITDNICNNNNISGIYLANSSSNTITGNTCIRGTGLTTNYTASQHTIRLASTGNNYNLIAMNNCMGKAVTVDGGTGNTLVNNKFDDSDDIQALADLIGTQAYTEDNYVTDGASDTANIDALDMAVKGNADLISNKTTIKTATITTSWSGSTAPYTQTISVSGMTASANPKIGVVYSTDNATAIDQKEAWNMVGKITTNNGSITVTCFEEKPTIAIPIQIEGVA